MDRFWRGFWRGFGEVLERFLEIILIPFSYCSAYRVGKDLGRGLRGFWIKFGKVFKAEPMS